jgi:di/tricarboxylate transporter
LQTALALGLSPYPLMMTVVVAASSAFLTPIGTPTNLLVMGPGGYQFRDYTIVGLPLFVVFMVASLLLGPLIWPL